MQHRIALAAIALTFVLAAAGCNSKITQPPGGGGATHTVTMHDNSFNSASLTIPAGDKVNWTNGGGTAHTATSDNGNFINTGTLAPGATSNSVTFSGAGTFTYHCSFHAGMTGTIIVQ